jgi:hypothetical protein
VQRTELPNAFFAILLLFLGLVFMTYKNVFLTGNLACSCSGNPVGVHADGTRFRVIWYLGCFCDFP